MTEDTLQLAVGSEIQIQTANKENPVRYKVRLVGYVPGKGLIVTNPEIHGRTVVLTDDQPMVVRILKGDVCQGFEVRTLQTAMLPFPHLHLSFPDDVATEVIRNAPRVETTLPAMVRNTNEAEEIRHEAILLDLSVSGAKIATKTPVAVAGEVLEVRFDLDVAHANEKLKLIAEVMSVRFREGNKEKSRPSVFTYGVMFRGINRYQELILHANVLQEELVHKHKRLF